MSTVEGCCFSLELLSKPNALFAREIWHYCGSDGMGNATAIWCLAGAVAISRSLQPSPPEQSYR